MDFLEGLDIRYEEPNQSESESETYMDERPRYVSDNTAFMRWSTEMEQVHHIIDNNFLSRNRIKAIDVNKFLPLSNIRNPKMLQIVHLRRQLADLANDADLRDIAEGTILDNVADYQTSRGIDGF